jgi:hypothetical protein
MVLTVASKPCSGKPGLAKLVNETIARPGSSAVLQLLGLATGTSAPLSRAASWAALVTAWSRKQLSTLDWTLR